MSKTVINNTIWSSKLLVVVKKIKFPHVTADATELFRAQGTICLLVVLWLLGFWSELANASGIALDKNKLVHGFDSMTDKNQVEAYIKSLKLNLSQGRQLIVVSGTHGICPTGAPDKSQGCADINFLKEDYALFGVIQTSYIQVVNYHDIKNWSAFINQHSNDYIVLAWCYSACSKLAPFYKVDYCPRNLSPSARVSCPGPSPGSPQNP